MRKWPLWLVGILCVQLSFAQEQATLLGTWHNPELVPSNIADNIYNEIWGYANGDKEYAIIGSTAGTHFIDVTDPSQPTEVQFVPGKAQGGVIIHRDYHDHNGYLYAVSDEGASSLQIMDITDIEDTVMVLYDSDELIRTAHNIFIDNEQEKLYAFATKNGLGVGFALRIYSLSDPLNPTFIAEHRTFDGLTVGHVHDGFVKDNIAFLNCGWDGFLVVDFTDPLQPVTKTKLTNYPQKGYNHSGWPSPGLDYYYMADESHGKDMKVLNVCDLEAVTVGKTFNARSIESNSIPHNQVAVCNYLYVSYYYDGLQVYDISDPKDPVRVMEYDTYPLPNDASYRGAWGVYPFLPSGNILVSDMQTGLYVFEAIDTNCTGLGITGNFEEDCEVDVNSSVQQPTRVEDWVNVYPTLVHKGDWLSLQLSATQQAVEIEMQLIDASGKTLRTYKGLVQGNNIITLPKNISKGNYLLKVNRQDQAIVKQIVVQ
ncbi:MAG: choice-of-anchor B family protein [Bacteroidetes bacterium]|nr:choice-of-anchor B family protein [Bacteroidota bacterium]